VEVVPAPPAPARKEPSGRAPVEAATSDAPRSARVEVRTGGERVTVGATDAGTLLGRAFFLAGLPPDTSMRTIRVAAFDAAGARVAALTLHGCG
jgi:hypothetical protein